MSEIERIYDPRLDPFAAPGDTEPRPFEATDGVCKFTTPSMGAFRALVAQVKALTDRVGDLERVIDEEFPLEGEQ